VNEHGERPKGWFQRSLERWSPFWIMVAGVSGVAVVLLTVVLVSKVIHPSPSPPVTPSPITSSPVTPVTTPPAPATTTAPPSAPMYYFRFDGSSQYPCSDEGTIRSVINGPEEPFSFFNYSSTYLQIIWLNDSGNRETEDTLAPGGTYSGNFYIGDAWLIATPNAACEGIFVVDSDGEVTTSSS
jgi:hypothetical protein